MPLLQARVPYWRLDASTGPALAWCVERWWSVAGQAGQRPAAVGHRALEEQSGQAGQATAGLRLVGDVPSVGGLARNVGLGVGPAGRVGQVLPTEPAGVGGSGDLPDGRVVGERIRLAQCLLVGFGAH